MSDERTSGTHAFSPWWVLLLLPVALLIGWFVGQVPGPKRQDVKVAASQSGTTASAQVQAPRTEPAPLASPIASPVPTGSATEVRSPDQSSPAVEKPAQEPRGELSQWTNLESAMAESQRNGKPVLIDFNADWCGPCQALKHQVFEDGARGQAVQEAVIPVSIVDRRREEGRNPAEIDNLQQRFQVNAFPTLIVFSAESGRVFKTQGFGGADATVAWIIQAAKAAH